MKLLLNMKFLQIKVAIFALLVLGLLSNRSGRNEGTTGAPNETDNVVCSNCHIRGPFKPGIQIELLENNSKVQFIKPNTTYTVNIQLTDSTSRATVYGFQMVPLNSRTLMAGSFPTIGTRVKRVNDLGRTYLSHSARATNSLFTATWTSPAALATTDSIKFYFAGVTGNDDNGSIGDNGITGTRTYYYLGSLTNNEDFEQLMPALTKNMVESYLEFSHPDVVKSIKIYDQHGKLVIQPKVSENGTAEVSGLSFGYYYVQFTSDKHSITRKFLKL